LKSRRALQYKPPSHDPGTVPYGASVREPATVPMIGALPDTERLAIGLV
jgi:hypothetical protein